MDAKLKRATPVSDDNIKRDYEISYIEAELAKMEGLSPDASLVAAAEFLKKEKLNGDRGGLLTQTQSPKDILRDLTTAAGALMKETNLHSVKAEENLSDILLGDENKQRMDLNDNDKSSITLDNKDEVKKDAKKEEPLTVEDGRIVLKPDPDDPLPLRVTPALYTYSNSNERSRDTSPVPDSESPVSEKPQRLTHPDDSMMQQLSIEIPSQHDATGDAKSTPRIRTRASSRLESPAADLAKLQSPNSAASRSGSPALFSKANKGALEKLSPKLTPVTAKGKRKRHESESSTHSCVSNEDQSQQQPRNKKSRRCLENAVELIKVCMGVDGTPGTTPTNNAKGGQKPGKDANKMKTRHKAISDSNETLNSSDSDEPLIEVAGKVRNSSKYNSAEPKSISTRHNSKAALANHNQKPNAAGVNANANPSMAMNNMKSVSVKIHNCDAAAAAAGGGVAMSTRRSVRMGGAAAAAAAAGGANKSGVVAATAPAVAVAAGGTTRSVPHAQSEDRRKTRSAGLYFLYLFHLLHLCYILY